MSDPTAENQALPSFWATSDPGLAADSLRNHVLRFAGIQSSRRSLAEKYAQATEGMGMTCLGAWGYNYDCDVPMLADEDIPIIRNVCHELVDTLTSKIGAIDPPLPVMLTNKGSWKDRRQATDLQDLVHAEYKSPKGMYANLHEVWMHRQRRYPVLR